MRRKEKQKLEVKQYITIDGAASDKIAGKFAEVYKKLYNVYNNSFDEEKVQYIKVDIQNRIDRNEVIGDGFCNLCKFLCKLRDLCDRF